MKTEIFPSLKKEKMASPLLKSGNPVNIGGDLTVYS